jgi:SWI/SNF-related matrix-associated actin-dependent regulator of chromatin subfamily A-like protein 1
MILEQYQVEGALFLVQRKRALLADVMGLGKTAQATYACDLLQARKILVVCPASVKYHWKNEFKTWSRYDRQIEIVKNGKHVFLEESYEFLEESYEFLKKSQVVIINYELLLNDRIFKSLREQNWDILICDEAHYLKALTSKRTKKILGSFGLAKRAEHIWMLTGTPVENRPVDLFPMLFVLSRSSLGKYNTYEKYVMHFCDGYYDQATGLPTPHGASNEKELNKALDDFMLRRTLEDNLPKTDVQVIRLSKTATMANLEEEIPQENVNDFFEKPIHELGALASLRQEIALSKMGAAIEYIKDTLKVLDKVVIFAYHRAVISMLEKELSSYKPVIYMGGLTAEKREEVRNHFITEKRCRVIIGQLKAAGTGLDGLQKVCHHMIFVEIDWVPFKQCIGRLKRMGQKKDKVIVQILVCEDSMEEAMLRTVKSKLKSINTILGD